MLAPEESRSARAAPAEPAGEALPAPDTPSQMVERAGFRIFGGEDPGLKARDLINTAALIAAVHLKLPGGWIVAAEQFDRLIPLAGYTHETTANTVLKTPLLPRLTALLSSILAEIPPMTPVAVRSSARSERGGLGIYESTFRLITGDLERDLHSLWEAVMKVYSSEFSGNATAWRAKTGGNFGVAVIIQPVIGGWHGDYFFPFLAGRGFSSLHGRPLVRPVCGLATEEALAEVGTYWKGPEGAELAKDIEERQKAIWSIHRQSGTLTRVDLSTLPDREALLGQITAFPLAEVFDALCCLKISADQDWYIEFAAAQEAQRVEILQCAPFEDKQPEPIVIDSGPLKEIYRCTDIVNHGIREGRGIVWLGLYRCGQEELNELEMLNRQLKNYAVFVPQSHFSGLTRIWSRGEGENFGYRHFSNAGFLCECQVKAHAGNAARAQGLLTLQVDHVGRGGMHFAQLCQRGDILFMGGEINERPIWDLPGHMAMRGVEVCVWDVNWVAVNDVTKGEGVFYLRGEPKVHPYSPKEIDEYGDHCYDTGRDLENSLPELSKAFFDLCFLIPTCAHPLEFDPFGFVPDHIVEVGGKVAALGAIDLVLGEGAAVCEQLELFDRWEEHSMRAYLMTMRERIEAGEESPKLRT